MIAQDYYKNNYPLEELLPDLKEHAEHEIVSEYDTTPDFSDLDFEFNQAQLKAIEIESERIAGDFYRQGYEAAKDEIEKKLTPCEFKLL